MTHQRFLAAAALAVVLPAFAVPVDPSPQRIEITAPSRAEEVLEAVRDLDAVYEMSDGRRMVVTAFDTTLRVRYGRKPEQLLRHDGQGRFVSRGGALVLTFQLDRSGSPRHATLSMPAAWQ